MPLSAGAPEAWTPCLAAEVGRIEVSQVTASFRGHCSIPVGRAAFSRWLLMQVSCSSDSLCFGFGLHDWPQLEPPTQSRQEEVHFAWPAKLFTSIAIIKHYKPYSKGLFTIHAEDINLFQKRGEWRALFNFLINNRLEVKTIISDST